MSDPPATAPADRPPAPGRPRWLVEMVVLVAGLTLTVFALGSIVARGLAVILTTLLVVMLWRAWTLARQRRLDPVLSATTAAFVLISAVTLVSVAVIEESRAPGAARAPAGGTSGDSGHTEPTGPAEPVEGEIALVDLEPVIDGSDWETRPVSLNGQSHTRALRVRCAGSLPTTVSYVTGSRFRVFRATVGIPDDSHVLDPVIVEIHGDGRRLAGATVEFGTPHEIEVEVAGLTRLDLRVEFPSEATCLLLPAWELVWVNARLLP